jgi:predicted cobalt transporter CbtA
MGALFSVAFIVAYSRFATVSVRAQSMVLASGAFAVVYLVPFLKYPANPPSIGDPDTIGKRTGLYLLMIVLSLAFATAAVWLARRLSPKLGIWGATLSGIGAYIVVMAVAMIVLPPVSEVPQPLLNDQGTIMFPGFSADDLFHFRVYTVGTQLIIWATIGLVFGALVSRLVDTKDKEMLAA